MPVPSSLPVGNTVANVEPSRHDNLLRLAEARHDARLVDVAVGGTDAAAEIGLEGMHGEVIGD